MADPAAFGAALKQRRKQRDLTQEQLAEQVGVALETIRKIERGIRRPSREIAARLAAVLHVGPDEQAEFLRLARLALPTPEPPVPMVSPPHASTDVPEPPVTVSQPAPLLATKLYRPRLRAEVVARPRLVARLDAGLAGPLTMIAAPAGFGKTTLLADWLMEQEQRGMAVAWLALDAGDADPLLFLRYLITAVQTIEPTVGCSVLTLLGSGQAPPLDMLLPLLLNDLVKLPDGSVLVLDDYHTIDAPVVHQALAFLLDHLPPQLHLVIATRVDPPLPLARLRVRGQLAELRADDLRFTAAEAATFFQDTMGLPLGAAAVAALEERTEGWVAGLQLAALAVRNHSPERRTAFIDAFTGSHRFVVDYLVDEVLARQPAPLQHFLLHTAILERLSGPLCDAVLPADASRVVHASGIGNQGTSQLLLEQLERSNLFLVPLDDARRWYRYHHLFAQVLRERLASSTSPELVATLHRRASVWFEEHGLAVEAVEHALAAHDWERAARVIEAHGLVLMMQGQVHTVLGWLSTLPDTLVRTRPFLDYTYAAALFCVNQLETAEHRLQEAERWRSTDVQDEHAGIVWGHATVLRAAIAGFRGDIPRWLTLARQALEILPLTDVLGRTAGMLNLASALLLSGDASMENERLLISTVASARTSGGSTLLTSVVALAALLWRQGRLRQAAVTYREAAAVVPEPAALLGIPNAASYYLGLGGLLREWNDLDAAERLLTQGRELVRGRLLAEADAVSQGYIALARLQQARGEASAALATLQEFEALAQERAYAAHLIARGVAAQAQVALRQGNLEPAVRWADTSGVRPNNEISYPQEFAYLTLARVRIAQGRRDPSGPALPDALYLLDRLLSAAEAGMRMDSVIEILILQALVLEAQGDAPRALVPLARALTLAAPEGYVRVFLDEGAALVALLRAACAHGMVADYAAHLLTQPDLSAPPAPVTPPGARRSLPEPLTERERDVLRLLAAGRSNRAIADELVVVVGTVKRHISSIMGKLQAESRLDAVARARDLLLL